MPDENIENLNGAIQHLLGRRQVAEGHGGKPLTATTNSVSSHCQGMSCSVGRRKEKREKHTQHSMENDQWPFCLGAMLGEKSIVSEVNGSYARPEKSCGGGRVSMTRLG